MKTIFTKLLRKYLRLRHRHCFEHNYDFECVGDYCYECLVAKRKARSTSRKGKMKSIKEKHFGS